ncbi:hypothetical protein N8I77_004925 [Diaporthe amygdali]|uniref:Nudix hydrolase domain-containing protein n=1 Tax=Phomopsis amygdali TaxID=1214568 RepID=A0AAD9SPE7_PHOAM|nr:hypothetical protein N8I77_004925 [Diaporthe amygdali]
MASKPPFTNLQLVERVDSWPYFAKDRDAYRRHMQNYHYLLIEGYDKPLGYVHNQFVEEIDWPDYWNIDSEKRLLTLVSATGFETRSRLMNETLRKNHDSQKVPELARWSAEDFPIYSATGEHVLTMNGCGVDMFGIVNFSVHMIGWVMTAEGVKIWVSRRAMTRMSYPGMLDNTVGGSLLVGEKPIDGIVRECEEEICLDPTYTRANIKPCGTNSFQLTLTDSPLTACQHQVQYLYEIELRQEIVPKIGDGEVSELHLKTIDEVREAMKNGEFKLSYNMTYLAFLIRHGYINAENEPDLPEIALGFIESTSFLSPRCRDLSHGGGRF